MSFYTVIKTELKEKQYILCAVEEMQKRGEITVFEIGSKKEGIKINRDGDIIHINKSKTGNYQVEGDARVVNAFSKRLKQLYAYESIKENLPFDFEIAQETEVAGEIKILLKG